MTRKRGVFVLVLLLVALLCLWWILQKYPLYAQPIIDLAPAPQQPTITIHHKKTKNNHEYKGELPVRLCDSFSTQVQTTNGSTTEVTLAFVVTTPDSCSGTLAPAPFEVIVSGSDGEIPTLKNVLINNAPASFTVVEDK